MADLDQLLPDDSPAIDTVRRAVTVDLDPNGVWELLVDDDERAAWFGGPTTLEPTPGGAGTFTDPDGVERVAVVTECDPGRRLSWTWWEDDGEPTRVRIDLEPVPTGTRVDVTERRLAPTALASTGPTSARAVTRRAVSGLGRDATARPIPSIDLAALRRAGRRGARAPRHLAPMASVGSTS